MRIRTQFLITTVLFGLVLIGVSISALVTNIRVGRTDAQQALASNIAGGANELTYLANDYIVYQENQQIERWQNKFSSFSRDVAGLDVNTPEQLALVLNIKANTARLKEVFDSVASSAGSLSGNRSAQLDQTLLRVSWSRMSVQSQGLISDSSRLAQLLDDQSARLQRENIIAIVSLVGVLIAYFFANFFLIQRRVLTGISKFRAGAAIIGGGNLDYKISEQVNDEIGDLSVSFNKMTSDLKTVTASKTELEKEIEGRKKAEEALKESEARANALIKYAPTGIYEIDFRTGKFLSVNEAMSRLTGYTREELFAMGPAALLDDESRKLFAERSRQQLAGNSPPDSVEYRIIKKDGSVMFVDLNVSFSKVNPGTVFVIGHDVTERKKAEEALKLSEEKFRSLNVNMNEGICLHEFVYDMAGKAIDYRILDINPAYAVFTGITREQAIGKKASELYGTGHPPYFDIYERVTASGKPESFETYFPPMQKYFSISVFSPGKGQFATVFNDITERKVTEKHLVEQATMLANVNDAVIGYDAGYRVTYWNRAAEYIYGYTPAEAMGKISNVLLKPTYPGISREELVLQINRDGHLEAESSRTTKNGRQIYIETHIIGLKDENDILTGYVAVDRDITERKNAEAEILHLASFPELNPNPIVETDASGNVIYANPAVRALFPEINESGSSHPFLVHFSEVSDEMASTTKDINIGDSWYEQVITYVPGTRSYRLYARDITGRRKTEEALRDTRNYLDNLLNYANAPIIVWNPAFNITSFNHAFERITGMASDDVLGRTLDILFPDESRDESMNHIREATSGERWEVEEIPIRHVDGTVRILLWNSANIYAPDGKTVIATIAQGQDISDRRQAEEALKRRTAELEASNKELEAFSYSVSHDLRAPLRSMEGFSSALLEDYYEKLDDQGKQYLKYVQESSELMASLIDDLLRLSRVTRTEMEYQTVDISALAQSILDKLGADEPDRKTEVSIERNMTASGDEGLLKLALENLIGNAWKFSSKNASARIEIGTTVSQGKKAYYIRDNGVGFDMQYSGKLFQPFQRLHKAVDFTGTGIGLATVQRIIRRHGGEVWAESKVGEGATFCFTLGEG
jgi:PAS domain S-box-containing protein